MRRIYKNIDVTQLLLITLGIIGSLAAGLLAAQGNYVYLMLIALVTPTIVIFLYPFLGLLLFAVFIPLESAFLGLGGGAATVTRILGLFIFFSWFSQLLIRRIKLKLPYPMVWTIIFFIWAALSYFWAWDRSPAANRLLTGFQLFMLALMVVNVLNSLKNLKLLIFALFVSCVIAGILGFSGIEKTSSFTLLTLEGAGAKEYATYIGIAFLISTIMLMYGNVKYRLLYAALSIILLYPLYATGERGVILAIGLAWLAILYVIPEKSKAAVAIVIVIGILYAAPILLEQYGFLSSWVAERFTLDSMIDSGGTGRLDIWKTGLVMVRENPLLGVGIGNFPTGISHYIGWVPNTRVSPYVDSHADWLNVLGEVGLIGTLLFLAMLINTLTKIISGFRSWIKQPYYVYFLIVWGLFIFILADGLTTTFIWRKIYWIILAMAIQTPILCNTLPEEEINRTI